MMKPTVAVESSKNNNRLRLFLRPVALFVADTYDKGVVSNPPFDRAKILREIDGAML
jgi:hypothetical protein